MKGFIAEAVVTTATIAAFSACGVEDDSAELSSSEHADSSSQYTTAQSNAIESANSHLETRTGFSRAGLIQRLTSKVHNRKDAVFAVNHVQVNWKEQAVMSAKSYMRMGLGMSRARLIRLLTSKAGEQYTPAQAKYAARRVGY